MNPVKKTQSVIDRVAAPPFGCFGAKALMIDNVWGFTA